VTQYFNNFILISYNLLPVGPQQELMPALLDFEVFEKTDISPK
jgi:hypothetical protein